MSKSEWNPGAYGRFREQRLRPAIDLMHALPGWSGGEIVDLGCGNGAMGGALAAHPGATRLTGVDSSPKMLGEARAQGAYDALVETDITTWQAEAPVGMIFSNAALHWLPDHAALLPRLIGMLAPGGVLAVQVPRQNNAPSHRVWHSLVDELFPGQVDLGASPGVLEPSAYVHLLEGAGAFRLWETEYYQVLPADAEGHPVRRFTESTFARPILAALGEEQQARLVAAYEEVMERAYPRRADGSVIFPFRRLFFTLRT